MLFFGFEKRGNWAVFVTETHKAKEAAAAGPTVTAAQTTTTPAAIPATINIDTP